LWNRGIEEKPPCGQTEREREPGERDRTKITGGGSFWRRANLQICPLQPPGK